MNKTIQFLNRSVFLSICLHLIGVGIATLSIVGTPDNYGDTIVAELVSLPKTKPSVKLQRIEATESARPTRLYSQPPRIQVPGVVPHIRQNAMQFAVEPLTISTVHQVALTEIGKAAEGEFQYRFPPRPTDSGSRQMRFASKRLPHPQLTSTLAAIASTQAAELPPISVLSSEPTQNARFSHKVDPVYPESARLSHKQGLVMLEATIGIDGIARHIEVIRVIEISGLGCEEAAITALKASRFVPARRGNVIVSQRLRIPYRFQFKKH